MVSMRTSSGYSEEACQKASFFLGGMMGDVGKSQIIKRIHNAAVKYKKHLVGNTYMFVYDNTYVEVRFKKSSFAHLTGAETKLSAEEFYKHALKEKGLRPMEVSFSKAHPFDLAEKKTRFLADLYKLTITDVVIATDIQTLTFTYSIGITDLEFVICLGDDADASGKIKSSAKVPYSFRVEEIDNSKFNGLYAVTHIFEKKTGEKKYSTMKFGDVKTIAELPEEIKNKIDLSLIK